MWLPVRSKTMPATHLRPWLPARSITLPQNYVAEVRPRSGLALKNSITVLNTPGTIDSGYRGEVHVILVNHGKEPFAVRRGDRIAQLLFQRLPEVELSLVDSLDESDRGEGGFGSTGRK